MATSAEFRAEQTRVKRLLKKWKPFFQLEGWTLTVAFHNGPIPIVNHIGAIATSTTLWQYREAEMHFDCEQTGRLSDDELEDTVVHELTHIPLTELANFPTEEHMEHVTTVIARIIQQAARG